MKTQPLKSVGNEIKNLRLVLHLSQVAMTGLLNQMEPKSVTFGRTDLSKYETGRVMPPADKYCKIMSLKKGEKN